MKHSIYMYPRYAKADSIVYSIFIDDLEMAVKAEAIAVGVQPGHIGTGDISFRINTGIKRLLPQPKTPGIPNCYFYKILGRDCIEIPLPELKTGENIITFFLGEQLCHGFNWPGMRLDDFGIRVYYDSLKTHASGIIKTPVNNTTIYNDSLLIEISVYSSTVPVKSIDLLGYYYYYPLDGTSEYTKWQYFIRNQQWDGNIGKLTISPYTYNWDLRLIPDQKMPMKLMVKITDIDGISYMTPVVENLILARKDRMVRLYEPYDVPENFKVRIGEIKKSRCEITEDIGHADTVILMNSKIYIGHLENKYICQFGLNNIMLMDFKELRNHHPEDVYPGSFLPIPLGVIKNGMNEFYIYDNTEGHMAEVYWPGPALLVSYDLSDSKLSKCYDRKTYDPVNGPMYDVEYFNYSASDTVFYLTYNTTERYQLLKSNEIGDYIDYTVYVPKGNYNISIGYISANGDSMMSRGQCRLFIDGAPQGEEWDQFGEYAYKLVYLGRKTFKDTGNKTFRMQVSGKNPLSKLPYLSVCHIGLEKLHSPQDPLIPPGDLVTQYVDGIIELKWSDYSDNENGFAIESKIPGGEFLQIGAVERNIKYFYYEFFSSGIQYTFRIKAFNEYGFSDYSNLSILVPGN
ncbi:MAG: hypothetical protein AMS27_11045 [Bacteroides sp. SM23_62_1]|nr:MAG: hypothetical protein AMS27_11045 [Bacteroides sp. SM23_62_1]